MSSSTRTRLVSTLCSAAGLWLAAAAGAQEGAPQDPGPPDTSAVCPAIDEDGLLCSSDLWSGNCADFVVAADKLGALYRSELQKLPDSAESLKTTNWWGCGSGTLFDVKRLLVTIGTGPAQAVLATEPYESLPPVEPPGARQPGPAPLTCDELPRQFERNACIGAQLQQARTAHQLALERCKGLVVAPLRDELAAEEASFQVELPARCAAAGAEGEGDPGTEAFDRSRCLAQALAQRDRGMLEAHPECAN